MRKTSLLFTSTILLVVVQFTILYFWIINWEGLYSTFGLLIWGISIIFGILIYVLYTSLKNKKGIYIVLKRVQLISTSITILLVIITLIIDFAVKSMP